MISLFEASKSLHCGTTPPGAISDSPRSELMVPQGSYWVRDPTRSVWGWGAGRRRVQEKGDKQDLDEENSRISGQG